MKINIRLKKDVPPALIAKLQEELGEYTFAWKEDIPTLTVSVFQKRKTIEALKKLELLDDSLNSERRRQDLYRGRYGILIGFLLFFFVLFFFSAPFCFLFFLYLFRLFFLSANEIVGNILS